MREGFGLAFLLLPALAWAGGPCATEMCRMVTPASGAYDNGMGKWQKAAWNAIFLHRLAGWKYVSENDKLKEQQLIQALDKRDQPLVRVPMELQAGQNKTALAAALDCRGKGINCPGGQDRNSWKDADLAEILSFTDAAISQNLAEIQSRNKPSPYAPAKVSAEPEPSTPSGRPETDPSATGAAVPLELQHELQKYGTGGPSGPRDPATAPTSQDTARPSRSDPGPASGPGEQVKAPDAKSEREQEESFRSAFASPAPGDAEASPAAQSGFFGGGMAAPDGASASSPGAVGPSPRDPQASTRQIDAAAARTTAKLRGFGEAFGPAKRDGDLSGDAKGPSADRAGPLDGPAGASARDARAAAQRLAMQPARAGAGGTWPRGAASMGTPGVPPPGGAAPSWAGAGRAEQPGLGYRPPGGVGLHLREPPQIAVGGGAEEPDTLTPEEREELAAIQKLLREGAESGFVDASPDSELSGPLGDRGGSTAMKSIRRRFERILGMRGGPLSMAQRQEVFALAGRLGLSAGEAHKLVAALEHGRPPAPAAGKPPLPFWRRPLTWLRDMSPERLAWLVGSLGLAAAFFLALGMRRRRLRAAGEEGSPQDGA